jgi:hypothetical protein
MNNLQGCSKRTEVLHVAEPVQHTYLAAFDVDLHKDFAVAKCMRRCTVTRRLHLPMRATKTSRSQAKRVQSSGTSRCAEQAPKAAQDEAA